MLAAHPVRWNHATNKANTANALIGPSPTRANLQRGGGFGADVLTTDVATSGSEDPDSVALIGTDLVAMEGLLSDS